MATSILTPKLIQHQFGQGTSSRIVAYFAGIQLNALILKNIVDVPLLLFVHDTILEIAAGFQFDFREGVDILFKKHIGYLWEVPDFMHLDNTVSFLHGFHHFGTAPRSLDGSFWVGMRARRLVPCICARLAQRKHQLVLTVMRQHGMEKTARWQYRAFDQSEIIGNVLVKILGNDLRMIGRYGLGSIDVGIKAGKVNVPNLLVSLATMVQFGCVGPTTEHRTSTM